MEMYIGDAIWKLFVGSIVEVYVFLCSSLIWNL